MNYKYYRAPTANEARQQAIKEYGTAACLLSTRKIEKKKFLGLIKEVEYELKVGIEEKENSPASIQKGGGASVGYLKEVLKKNSVETNEKTRLNDLKSIISQKYNQPSPDPKTILEMQARANSYEAKAYETKPRFNIEPANSVKVPFPSSIPEPKIEFDRSQDSLQQKGQTKGHGKVYRFLKEYEFSDELAEMVEERCGVLHPETLDGREKIARFIASLVEYAGEIVVYTTNPNLVFLVGPTGVGKTTTLAKLCAHFAVVNGRSCVLATYDYKRMKAIAQLEHYAQMMGVPFRPVIDEAKLSDLYKEHIQSNILFVDTCGVSRTDDSSVEEVARFVGHLKSLKEIHLCLNAALRKKEMELVLKEFQRCGYDRVIITKVDESGSLGTALSVVIKNRVPVSYITLGQDVPNDILPASREGLSNLLMKEWENA